MDIVGNLRVRRSIFAIYKDYLAGKTEELVNLIRAWKGIIDISKGDDPYAWNSFFKIAGLHGEPFRGAGFGNPAWWGGYCHHGNVLFPTWHRAYCLRIEDALRSIPGCEDVTLPYWDEAGDDTKNLGVPQIFLDKTFTFPNGDTIDNPLLSYELPVNIVDHVDQGTINENLFGKEVTDKNLFGKGKGYKTVRFPYSGLVGTDAIKALTEEWNKTIDPACADKILNDNVKAWLHEGTRARFENCLRAPSYTVFSNGTSAGAFNDTKTSGEHVTSLEEPHDEIHLAVGGFHVGSVDYDPLKFDWANGDMGENDTSALDPIFYFHHAEIDRYFWRWQNMHLSTHKLDIIEDYPGTNSVDYQGPTPGVAGGTWLNLDTELRPFKKHIRFSAAGARNLTSDDHVNIDNQLNYLTSRDVINIEKLGYMYDVLPPVPPKKFERSETSVRITSVNKNDIAGSHQLLVYADKDLVAAGAVLSRWHVRGCANCQLSADRHQYVPLPNGTDTNLINVRVATKLGRKVGQINAGGTEADPIELKPQHQVLEKGETFALSKVRNITLTRPAEGLTSTLAGQK